MTTNVNVTACCAPDKEVRITIADGINKDIVITIQNGETYNNVVYGERSITTKEVDKLKE